MSDQSEPKLSINSWLEDELYQTYLHDKKYVDESWKKVFDSNGHGGAAASTPAATGVNGYASVSSGAPAVPVSGTDELVPMRGVAAKIAENMTASLTVPTATTQRLVPVRALEQARQRINQHREAAGQPKISYTHLITSAILRALEEFPGLNDAYTRQNGNDFRIVRKQINFGIAVDVKAKDGSSTLMVPNIKDARALSFPQLLDAFDDVVGRARSGKLQMADFQGTSISLTNPGTVGTLGSVPRLVVGQGAIIATGAMDYPAEFSTVRPEVLEQLGITKVMMVTCTYDHRIIQGADSGRFLGKLQALLNGDGGFYDRIYGELGVGQASVQKAAPAAVAPAVAPQVEEGPHPESWKEAAVAHLINAYRVRGHLLADIDPLGEPRFGHPDLEPATHGLTEADLHRKFASVGGKTLREVLEDMRKTYSRHLACEYMYIPYPDQKEWLRERMESTRNESPLGKDTQLRIIDRLIEAELFEQFLQRRFIGKKRFSLEGGDSAIPALDTMLERAAESSAAEAVIGMAHRGRLNVLANIVGKSIHQVLAEFEEAPDATFHTYGSGDVKYHLGASGVRHTSSGEDIKVSVAFNPSHLEAVDPVVEGMVRQRQDRIADTERNRIIPILIHGDAAFIGQGVVLETLNLSQLEGYTTGGTVHLVINNQLGFTTPPAESRSGHYATDIAKAIHAPILHVNGDDPEAAVRASQLAFDFRREFHRDVVIDLMCYRRYGHNEGDDPSYTQPLMYKKIERHPTVLAQYSERLISEGVLTREDFERRKKAFSARLSEGYDLMKRNAEDYELQDFHHAAPPLPAAHTAIDERLAARIIEGITTVPQDFHLHAKLKGFLEKRKQALQGGAIDWALGEALAFGSLVLEGNPVRLSGQDSGRGTFSQRHLEFYDVEDGRKYVAMQHLSDEQAAFEVWDSSLSEFAVMGFEFGYSLGETNALVLWEGQFGDFVNGAQIIIDQFLSSAETKWGQPSGLVLLLPHGYEGQGPEHSSARIERFLHLCAENNLIVANCSTPAQYFHILRRQMKGGPDEKPLRKPLILFTPKSLLRAPKAVSHLNDVTSGTFLEVIDDTAVSGHVKRVLFCSGKIYNELLAGRAERKADHVAIVRVEQMYPFPQEQLQQVIKRCSRECEIYWVQEEPRNMGAWRFMFEHMQPLLDESDRTLHYAGRPESASPAAGASKRHDQEQADIVADAFAALPVIRNPRRVKVVKKKAK
jgi:2-oxoglutarate dehydrogenase E1 component